MPRRFWAETTSSACVCSHSQTDVFEYKYTRKCPYNKGIVEQTAREDGFPDAVLSVPTDCEISPCTMEECSFPMRYFKTVSVSCKFPFCKPIWVRTPLCFALRLFLFSFLLSFGQHGPTIQHFIPCSLLSEVPAAYIKGKYLSLYALTAFYHVFLRLSSDFDNRSYTVTRGANLRLRCQNRD